jgi:hypothetical protein
MQKGLKNGFTAGSDVFSRSRNSQGFTAQAMLAVPTYSSHTLGYSYPLAQGEELLSINQYLSLGILRSPKQELLY